MDADKWWEILSPKTKKKVMTSWINQLPKIPRPPKPKEE